MEEKEVVRKQGGNKKVKKIGKRYQLLEEIGKGGNSQVFLAYDEKLATKRVVKMMRGKTSKDNLLLRQQFITEVYFLNNIRHPGIPQIYDYVIKDDVIFLVLEYIEGDDLQSYIKKEGLKREKEVLEWGIQLCGILRCMHERTPPFIHLDIKPSNIIRSPDGCLFLIDFGISQEGTESYHSSFVQGTKKYAAPEQFLEEGKIDIRTDMYSFGKVLQFCLWGVPDFSKMDRNPVRKETELFLRKCTMSSPDERYQNTREMERALEKLLKSISDDYHIVYKKIALTISCILLVVAVLFLINMKMKSMKADYNLECAKESLESDQVMYYYEEAVKAAPWKEEIYKNMLEEYILPDYFSTENAVRLLNILEKTRAMMILSHRNSELYAKFCYEMGMGYFYHMGGIKGKQESSLWFQRALQCKGRSLSEIEKKRAECHRKIGEAYRSFLTYEVNMYTRRAERSYKDFFDQLKELLDSDLSVGQNQDMSQRMLYEILTEISNYVDKFLSVSDISSDMILKMLTDVEDTMDVYEEGNDELYKMIRYIKTRIQIVGEKGETDHSKILDMDTVDSLSDE